MAVLDRSEGEAETTVVLVRAGCKAVEEAVDQYLAMEDTKSVILEKTAMVVGDQEAPTITVGTRTVVQAVVVDETIL